MYYYKILPKAYKLILIHVIIITSCEIAGNYLSYGNKNNSWVFNIFWILPELVLMSWAGAYLIPNRTIKRTIPFLVVLGLVLWAGSIYINGINTFANYYFLYVCLVLIVIYLSVLLGNLFDAANISKQPFFWLSLSVLLYFSCDLPYFGLHSLLIDKYPVMAHRLYNINTVLNFIRYPLVAVSFYMLGKQTKNVYA